MERVALPCMLTSPPLVPSSPNVGFRSGAIESYHMQNKKFIHIISRERREEDEEKRKEGKKKGHG